MEKQLLLIELNEVNFDIVRQYVDKSPCLFPTFRKILSWDQRRTSSESCYDQLEPWIQWVSAHTGKTFEQHKVFRLGDIVNSDHDQIFERVEAAGFTVGAISPMNTKNNLADARYFVPDPWTDTQSDKSWWSRQISKALSQAVNDNATSRLEISTVMIMMIALIKFAKISNYTTYLKLFFRSLSKTWNRALFLDLFLSDLHLYLLKKKRPDFSTVFFNAGAHIQHHYLYNSEFFISTDLKNPQWYCNSEHDPIKDMILLYEKILSHITHLNGYEIIIATGLTQIPYNRTKFYYRLVNHRSFLETIGIPFTDVTPLMTRDFVIHLGDNTKEVKYVADKLKKILVGDGIPLFNEIEERDDSLFVSLTYPNEIATDTYVVINDEVLALADKVAFVAIKNGMHDGIGFSFYTHGAAKYAPKELAHVAELSHTIGQFFGLPKMAINSDRLK
jgi:hypothetical protein